jgi:ligand-binding sensor domain-containing protein
VLACSSAATRSLSLTFVTYSFKAMTGCQRSILTALLLFVLPPALMAQFRVDNAINLTEENKLPNSDPRGIRIGKDGFVWFGTNEGLCRFDGQAYKMFRYNPSDPASLYDETVNAVLPLQNEIWVATARGISVMNKTTEKFRHYQLNDNGKTDSLNRSIDNAASTIVADRQGKIWIGTRGHGAWMYDPLLDSFIQFKFSPDRYHAIIPTLTSNRAVLSIESCSKNDSIVWVGTGAGLQEINKINGIVNWYTFPQADKDYQASLNAFRRLYYHDDGLLYAGSWGAGVNVFNPTTKELVPLPVHNQPGADMLSTPIANIVKKSNSEIWITTGAGLLVYNSNSRTITFTKYNDATKGEFYGVDCVDSLNRIWFCNINGIYYFDPVMQQFSRYSYAHLYGNGWSYAFYIIPDRKKGTLVVCPRAANGIYIFDRKSKTWEQRRFSELVAMKLPRITVRGFGRLKDNRYIISSDEGVFTYDDVSKQLRPFTNLPKTVFNQWGSALVDKAGNVWISANIDGLTRIDAITGKYRLYRTRAIIENEETPIKASYLYEDSRHNIWFAGNSGFGLYLKERDTVFHFSYRNNKDNSFPTINGFAEDKEGRIWLNTTDEFIGYCDINHPLRGAVRKIRLGDKNIKGKLIQLAADQQGNVWGYNDACLFKITHPDKPFEIFSFQYGVKKVDFFHFSFLPSGELLLGGRNDITLANPGELRRNTELPVPYVVSMKVLNRAVAPEQHAAMKLGHDENFISISFSARAHSMASGTRFRYRLSGFSDWNETVNERVANYTNVPSGDYVFELQAANNEGKWNENILQIPVHIATPWWQTWWFRLSMIILAIALVWSVYRYRVNLVKKKEQVKSQYEKKLANVEMSALLAQMNPHFLFNSLNSIDSYIIKNESKKASEYLNNFARLMRLILQNSRSNYITLKDELEALDLYLQMESLRFNNRFAYAINTDESVEPSSTLIPPMLIQPYVENAIWHGLMHKKDGTPGKVSISISKKENNLYCIIEDNGIGREQAQAQKSVNRKKSMGMQITRDRMEMINKLYNTTTTMQIIDLADENGNASGTRVELVIPV